MNSSPLLDQLIEAFRCLPGVGPKSAQRMALHLLERERRAEESSAQRWRTLSNTLATVSFAGRSLKKTCRICASNSRNKQQYCVVESPADVFAIEQSGSYQGVYFVLMGHLSPIDGIGPEQLAIPKLVQQVADSKAEEVIIACNSTVEGDATLHCRTAQGIWCGRFQNCSRRPGRWGAGVCRWWNPLMRSLAVCQSPVAEYASGQ